MDFNTIINRHSVRRFTDRPLTTGHIGFLNDLINRINQQSGLSVALVANEPEAFGKSLMAHYGHFENVTDYLCIIGNDTETDAVKAGYYGEEIVLEAQNARLNTCWVGLTFKKNVIPVNIGPGMKLHCVIAIGYGATQGMAHKTKSIQQLGKNLSEAPEWFHRGIESVRLAPSALNAQNYRLEWLGEQKVKISGLFHLLAKSYTPINIGIAIKHFEAVNPDITIDWTVNV